MTGVRGFRNAGAGTLLLGVLTLSGCHDRDEAPEATPPLQVSEYVLENMRRGGRVRPVIYTPPVDLAAPDPQELEPPFPGPGTDGPGPEVVEDDDDDEPPPSGASNPGAS